MGPAEVKMIFHMSNSMLLRKFHPIELELDKQTQLLIPTIDRSKTLEFSDKPEHFGPGTPSEMDMGAQAICGVMDYHGVKIAQGFLVYLSLGSFMMASIVPRAMQIVMFYRWQKQEAERLKKEEQQKQAAVNPATKPENRANGESKIVPIKQVTVQMPPEATP
jgi:hypothetical protein